MARPAKNQPVDLTKRIPLTSGLIERLSCRTDTKAQVFLRDSEAPGLRVRCTNTQEKSFVFEGKLYRQTVRITLGSIKVWSIEQARAEARRLAVMIDAGRPGKEPRHHPVPLASLAKQALNQVKTWATSDRPSRTRQTLSAEGTFLFSTDGGKTHITANAMSVWSKKAAKAIAGFQAKRIRSGVETVLAGMRVSKDDRGHLLSHGVRGVQEASYDGHDYMDVKISALESLERFLNDSDAAVIPVSFSKAA